MSFLRELTIERFRGIKNAHFSKLGAVNILFGNNNSGKTSIIEAISLLANPCSESHVYRLARLRETGNLPILRVNPLFHLIKWIFPIEQGERKNINITATINEEQEHFIWTFNEKIILTSNSGSNFNRQHESLIIEEELQNELEEEQIGYFILFRHKKNNKIIFERELQFLEKEKKMYSFSTKSSFNRTSIITPIDHRSTLISGGKLNDVIKSGDREKLIKALQFFDNNIQGIELLYPEEMVSGRLLLPIPYIDHKILGLSPITIFGDGLRKALLLAIEVINCKNGILLVDELETAIHASVIGDLFDWLVKICMEFHVQLFATTHSIEAIDAILTASKNNLEKLVAYRLHSSPDYTKVKRFSGENLYNIRFFLGQDVR